ncbi:MAG: 23S rRNA (uracil(1939)-C(5))-methyltransferase RlmD [Myxococcota bacterium]|nr:23S rRNA (uracil(1939)-C(5))-methyltransferase RlmD [Myxococcota bacterium]MEC9390816.1 23S rRNA (uracil(1939)-C(5))-methyltransferase RlmD [Myxococcota bacterium]
MSDHREPKRGRRPPGKRVRDKRPPTDDGGPRRRADARPPRKKRPGPPTGVERVVVPTRWIGRGETVVEGRGKPLVVWGGIPGEAGRVVIYNRGQNQDRARWLGADEPDPRRRVPPCDKYDRCGGCPLMHLESGAQDDVRLSMVRDLFATHGLDVPVPSAVVPCPDGPENYRHSVKMACTKTDHGRLRLGAYQRDSHYVLPIPNCRVATSGLRRAMGSVTHHIIEHGVPPYEEATDRGVLRHVLMRQSRLTGEILVTLVCARRPRDAKDLADAIAQNVATVAGVHLHINSHPGNAIFHVEDGEIGSVSLTGRATLDDEIAGTRLRFGPTDFFQVNPSTAERIVADAMALTADLADRPVVDLYCGVGTFALPFAKRHPWVGGIEFSVGAIARAQANARLLKLPAEFLAGSVAETIPQWVGRVRDAAPVVVLDPARKGLEPEAFDPIASLQPARMVYISCNPAALARDLAEWVRRGWSVGEVRAYDMFPQTAHLEMLAVLSPPTAPVAKSGGPRRRIVR